MSDPILAQEDCIEVYNNPSTGTKVYRIFDTETLKNCFGVDMYVNSADNIEYYVIVDNKGNKLIIEVCPDATEPGVKDVIDIYGDKIQNGYNVNTLLDFPALYEFLVSQDIAYRSYSLDGEDLIPLVKALFAKYNPEIIRLILAKSNNYVQEIDPFSDPDTADLIIKQLLENPGEYYSQTVDEYERNNRSGDHRAVEILESIISLLDKFILTDEIIE